jgi:predicted glycosyltransferase
MRSHVLVCRAARIEHGAGSSPHLPFHAKEISKAWNSDKYEMVTAGGGDQGADLRHQVVHVIAPGNSGDPNCQPQLL